MVAAPPDPTLLEARRLPGQPPRWVFAGPGKAPLRVGPPEFAVVVPLWTSN